MKVRLKTGFLALCMLTAILFLGGCTDAEGRTSNVDERTALQFTQMSAGLLENIFTLSEEAVREQIHLLEEERQFVVAGGLKSYLAAKKEVGSFQGLLEEKTDVIKHEEGYSVYLQLEGERRNCEIIVGFDRDAAKITQLTFNPEYTRAEKVKNAGLNTLLGMGTVFIVLILIALIIGAFKYINRLEQKFDAGKEKKGNAAGEAKGPADPVISGAPKAAPLIDMAAVSPAALGAAQAADFVEYAGNAVMDPMEDAELVAVLTAAVMAYRGSAGGSGLIVRSIKRSPRRR